MQVQLNTDANIQGHESLAAWVESELAGKLERFREHITRIEVHLSDNSAARAGPADKRCTLEARLAGKKPAAVSHDAGTVADAFHGAADKLMRALETSLGRAKDAHRRDSVRGSEAE